MKGNEKKSKEVKKAKADGTKAKIQSDYQKEKTRTSSIDPIVPKAKR